MLSAEHSRFGTAAHAMGVPRSLGNRFDEDIGDRDRALDQG